MKNNGPWRIKDSQVKYKNPWISVREDQVTRPDGKDGIFGVVEMVAGASVLPLDDDGFVYLTKEFHYAIEQDSIEVVSGAIDEGETAFEAAKREILEETGLSIKNLRIKATGNAFLKDLNLELYFHFIFADYEMGKLLTQAEDGELVWLSKKEIGKLENLLAEIRELLPYLFKESNRVISYKAVYEKGNKMTEFCIEKP